MLSKRERRRLKRQNNSEWANKRRRALALYRLGKELQAQGRIPEAGEVFKQAADLATPKLDCWALLRNAQLSTIPDWRNTPRPFRKEPL